MMFLFKIFLLVLIIGALTSILTFVRDVTKWHDKEEKVKIIPSQPDSDLYVITEISDRNESEVVENASND